MTDNNNNNNNYEQLTPSNIIEYLRTLPQEIQNMLGDLGNVEIQEISDGNINLVYLVKNTVTKQNLVIKQALPYLRKYKDWALTLSRANFEVQVLKLEKKAAPEHVPNVYYFDEEKRAIIMEFVSPHIILRKEMVKKIVYPHLGEHLGTFLAQTLFSTSDFCLNSREKKKLVKNFAENQEMCELTEQVYFCFPFRDHPTNSCSKQSEEIVRGLRNDIKVRVRVSELLRLFVSSSEALLHGDLHSGSVMVTPTSTVCIDPEFGYVGPMGFDIGTLLANFFMSYFSHMQGHFAKKVKKEEREKEIQYQNYLLKGIITIWTTFCDKFRELWGKEGEKEKENHLGPNFFYLEGELTLAQNNFFQNLERDVVGFLGTEIVRRFAGVAKVEDLLSIEDEEVRGRCEKMGLEFAMEVLRGEVEGGVKGAVERAREMGNL